MDEITEEMVEESHRKLDITFQVFYVVAIFGILVLIISIILLYPLKLYKEKIWNEFMLKYNCQKTNQIIYDGREKKVVYSCNNNIVYYRKEP